MSSLTTNPNSDSSSNSIKGFELAVEYLYFLCYSKNLYFVFLISDDSIIPSFTHFKKKSQFYFSTIFMLCQTTKFLLSIFYFQKYCLSSILFILYTNIRLNFLKYYIKFMLKSMKWTAILSTIEIFSSF